MAHDRAGQRDSQRGKTLSPLQRSKLQPSRVFARSRFYPCTLLETATEQVLNVGFRRGARRTVTSRALPFKFRSSGIANNNNNSLRSSSRRRLWQLDRSALRRGGRCQRRSGVLHAELLSIPEDNISHFGSSLSYESIASLNCLSVKGRASCLRPAEKF